MQILNQFPPNIEAIRKRFELDGFPTAVFTYGDKLYNPVGLDIPPDLMAHEEVHEKQQAILGVQQWWDLYLTDDTFRLSQEVEAYKEQYQHAKENYNRDLRRQVLSHIVHNLSSKLYGKIINKKLAKELIYG